MAASLAEVVVAARVPYGHAIGSPHATPIRGLAVAACLLGAAWLGVTWRDQDRLAEAGEAVAAGRPAEGARLAEATSGPTVEPLRSRIAATAAYRQGDLPLAERRFAEALRRQPDDWALRRDHAVVLLMLRREADARRELARALDLNPLMPVPRGFGPRGTR